MSEYTTIAELNDGISIVRIPVEGLREQDINARVMDDAKFNQLVANIRKRGTLEQLPYCVETERGIEIVSGHHRTRAARQAGLSEIEILLDRSNLSRSAIAAKQLAHNAIEGTDDEDMLRKIAAVIVDVDDMIESAIDPKYFEPVEVEKASIPSVKVDFEWKTVQFTFLPHQIEDLKELCDEVQGADFEGIADLEQFDGFVEALQKTQKFMDIRNVGAAVHAMTEKALRDYRDEDDCSYQTAAQVFGRALIPEDCAAKIREMIAYLSEEGIINNPWEIFEYISHVECGLRDDG